MRLPFQPTFNSIVMILIGVGMIFVGIWLGLKSFTRELGAGLFFTGIGNLLFGLTNGFIDMTSTGRLLFRIAVFAYLLGVPLLAYVLFVMITSG